MPVLSALLLSAAAGSFAGPVVELETRSIRASDLAELRSGGEIVVGTLPHGAGWTDIDPETARRLIANRLPGARFRLRHAETIRLAAGLQPDAGTAACYRAQADIAPGAIIRAADVCETQCAEEPVSGALSYDRWLQAPIARDAIFGGEYLGSLRPAADDLIAPGGHLVFRTGAGPVVIEREVDALQAGRPGDRIFARTSDGEVVTAPIVQPRTTPETEQ